MDENFNSIPEAEVNDSPAQTEPVAPPVEAARQPRSEEPRLNSSHT